MNKKVIIWIVVIVALAIAAYFLYNYFKNKREQDLLNNVVEGGTTPAVTLGPGTSSGYSDKFPLMNGSKGSNVSALQTAINKSCAPAVALVVDGGFGPKTAAAADLCLATKPGHTKGQVAYAEYQYLLNKSGAAVAGTSSGVGSGAGSTNVLPTNPNIVNCIGYNWMGLPYNKC